MQRLVVVLGLAVLVALAGSAVARSREGVDSPRIVPWTQIGGVRLGDKVSTASTLYGAPTKIFRQRTPFGTRWYGHRVLSYRYPVSGGVLWVTAVDDRVRVLGTTSPRYRTPGGIRVGSAIRRGTCHPNGSSSCEYRWHEFVWDECRGWVAERSGLQVLLVTHGGRATYIEFGDPAVLLLCF
jgi:hypothetical protein